MSNRVQGLNRLTPEIGQDGGSFLSANTARVDPSGNDSTGTVGDPTKPFLTAQAALTALEAGGPYTQELPAVLLLPMKDTVEDLTTSLSQLRIIGLSTSTLANPAVGNITLTDDGTSDGGLILALTNLYTGNVSATNVDPGYSLTFFLNNSILSGDVTTTGSLEITSNFNTAMVGGNISPGAGKDLSIRGLRGSVADSNASVINAPGSQVKLYDSYIDTIEDADTIIMQDSVVVNNNSGATPTVADFFMNPVNFDFSTLPTSLPSEVGKAWIDTTGGFNIVKVKL